MSQARARVSPTGMSAHGAPARQWWEGSAPGGEVAALASALVLTAAAAETAFVGRLCLGAALMVRPRDFFTVGVLPPLLMAGTMVIVALNGPKVIAAAHDSVVQAVVTGLAHHSLALFAGYAVCLLTLLARQRAARTR